MYLKETDWEMYFHKSKSTQKTTYVRGLEEKDCSSQRSALRRIKS